MNPAESTLLTDHGLTGVLIVLAIWVARALYTPWVAGIGAHARRTLDLAERAVVVAEARQSEPSRPLSVSVTVEDVVLTRDVTAVRFPRRVQPDHHHDELARGRPP